MEARKKLTEVECTQEASVSPAEAPRSAPIGRNRPPEATPDDPPKVQGFSRVAKHYQPARGSTLKKVP